MAGQRGGGAGEGRGALGQQLLTLINDQISPSAKLAKFPPPKNPDSIRAGHFELWLAPGRFDLGFSKK